MSYDERDLYTGLATLSWLAYDDPGWDHDYYKRLIEQEGGVALDVGCGTGRLLRSYLRTGLQVEGCDISGEMLTICKDKAVQEGLPQPVLYEQAMQDLNLPRCYTLIYIPCGSFVCVMDPEQAMTALRRFHTHLEPGGLLAFNIFLCEHDYSGKSAEPLPTPWHHHHTNEFPESNRRLVIHRRTTSINPVEQIETEERRYEMYEGDTLLKEEVHAGQFRWYFRNEMLVLLKLAGFTQVEVTGDYTDEPYGPQHTGTMVFLARKEK